MQFKVLKSATYCLLLSLFLMPGLTFAGQLIMKNGDIITGDVTKIVDDEVYIKPSYAGEYSVDLNEVVSIEADRSFEIELADGSEIDALFAGASDDGQILIVDGAPKIIGLMDLAKATEPENYYTHTSHVDVNATYNSGNTDTQNTLIFADTRVKLGDHRHLAELTFRRDETDGVTTKKQDLLQYEYNWLFNEPWYFGGTGAYERDPIRELKFRYTLGAVLGRDFINDSKRFLTASIGAGFSDEEIAGVSEGGSVGLWKLIYEHNFRGGDIKFFHNNNVTFQFYGLNNTILKSNTGFRFDIIDNVYANLSFRYDYETDPAPGASKDDTTLAIGVGAEF